MSYDLGLLLKQIDKESLGVQRTFAINGQHLNLDDFVRAINAYETVERLTSANRSLSGMEAEIVARFYAALAFRMVDTSITHDPQKFKKAEEILERARYTSQNSEPSVHWAKYYLKRRLAELSSEEKGKIDVFERIDYLINSYLSSEYLNLIFHLKGFLKFFSAIDNIQRTSLSTLLRDSWRLVKSMGSAAYETIRGGFFLYFSFTSLRDLSRGQYESAAVRAVVAFLIPYSRFYYKQRKVEELLGPGYRLPQLKPAYSIPKTFPKL